MTLRKLMDVPADMRKRFPRGAQELYRAAYNQAWEKCAASGEYDDEEVIRVIAHNAALLAVELEYQQDDDGRWRRVPVADAIGKEKIRKS